MSSAGILFPAPYRGEAQFLMSARDSGISVGNSSNRDELYRENLASFNSEDVAY